MVDPQEETESDAGTLLRQDVLKLFRVGAVGAAIFATTIGIVEFAVFGLEYWGSVATSTGTGTLALLFFWLTYKGKDIAASWILIVGLWFMILVDTAFQAGSATQGVVALPLLVFVAVWLTGSTVATYALVIASILTLVLVETLLIKGVIEPHGISSPFVGVMVIGIVLTLSAYIALKIYQSHLQRLHRQQKLTDSLAESQYDTQLILDNSMAPFYRADLDGNIIMISPSIERITGYDASDLIGKPLTDYYADPNKREELLQTLVKDNGEVNNFEAELICKDGSLVTLSTSARYWQDREGNILGVEGNTRDVTHMKDLQDKIERAGRVEVLDQLSGGLAHNFNNLLAIVLGNSEMIRLSLNDPKEVERRLTMIEQATERGVDLTRRMMSFSTHAMAAETSTVDVNELITNIGPMIRTSFSQDIELELKTGSANSLTDCHPGELEDAIINLAMNARDAVSEDGHITISTRNGYVTADEALNPEFKTGECVVITVQDNGEGIPENLVNRVIEPFFTTKSKHKGTGLGLSMVYGFARRYGGDLRFESTVDSGTQVTLLLPRSAAEPEPRVSTDQTTTNQSLGRILVVEDEPQLLELSERRLQALGFETVGLESGISAKAFLESKEPIDVVFSDVVMPGGIDGFDLVDILNKLRPGTPIVLCTGYAGTTERNVHPDIPVLKKPFRANELSEAITQAMALPHH